MHLAGTFSEDIYPTQNEQGWAGVGVLQVDVLSLENEKTSGSGEPQGERQGRYKGAFSKSPAHGFNGWSQGTNTLALSPAPLGPRFPTALFFTFLSIGSLFCLLSPPSFSCPLLRDYLCLPLSLPLVSRSLAHPLSHPVL